MKLIQYSHTARAGLWRDNFDGVCEQYFMFRNGKRAEYGCDLESAKSRFDDEVRKIVEELICTSHARTK